jgi:FkbM family methyltransferase
MSAFNWLARGCDLLADRAAWRYLLRTSKPSFASYRMCRAVRALVDGPLSTIVDVGANQGQFAGAAAWWFPNCRIISFEPSPRMLPILRKNTKRLSNIELVAKALGDREGELEFFENAHSHASSALVVNETQVKLYGKTANFKKIMVPVTTLDGFMADRATPGPILLKLDIQGFEKRALQGGRKFLQCVDFLLFECSFRALYCDEPLFAELYAYADELGFQLVAPVGLLADENNVILQADLLWSRKVPKCAPFL